MRWPTEEESAQLKTMPETPLLIGGLDMVCLLGAMQLALRHPQFAKSPSAEVARVFAEELEKRIVAAVPAFKELCAAGWNPEEDR